MLREFSSGGIVYKRENGQVLWLVAKSNPSDSHPDSYWRLPKGWLDDDHEGEPGPYGLGYKKATDDVVRSAAIREVKEEAGVEAEIIKKVDTIKYFYTFEGDRILKFVTFYLMEWKKDLPEGFGFETSEVAWLPFEEARKRLKNSGEKKILEKAQALLV